MCRCYRQGGSNGTFTLTGSCLALVPGSEQFRQVLHYDVRAVGAAVKPERLLALTILVAGVLSAVLVNDIVVFSMAPMLCAGLKARGRDPRPYLVALAGAILGMIASLGATGLLRTFLFHVRPGDPVTLVAVAGVLLLVALLACYLPARRATRIDPLVALRHE